MSLDSVIRETIINVKPEDEDVIIKKLLLELSKEIHREVKKSILANIKGINKRVDKIDIEGIIAFNTPNMQIQKDRNKKHVYVSLMEHTYPRFENHSRNWEDRYSVNKQYGLFFKDAISKELQQDRIELGGFCLYYLHDSESDHTRFDDGPFRIFLDEKKVIFYLLK